MSLDNARAAYPILVNLARELSEAAKERRTARWISYDEFCQMCKDVGVKETPRTIAAKLLKPLQAACIEKQLPDFGYYPLSKKGEFVEYDTESDLRDTENVPLKDNIYAYFQREVRPHVAEAWINLDATKIGYEISFNKYFYRHKPLRTVEAVAADILALEAESDGLIREILGL